MYRLIACDLDETLLNDKKVIASGNLRAIEAAVSQGAYFVCATGRGYTCLDDVLQQLGQKQQKSYLISMNGGIICRSDTFAHLFTHPLDRPLAEELFAFGLHADVCVQVFTAADVYAFHLNADEKNWLFRFKPDSIESAATSLDFLHEEKIYKVMLQNTDMNYLRQLGEQIIGRYGDRVCVSYSSNRYLELNAPGVDKGTALCELAGYLNIPLAETLAIGDNHNDISMIRMAGLGAAVANAQPDIRAVSDYVSPCDHNHDAVAEILQRFVL